MPLRKPGNALLDLLRYIKDPDAYIAEQVKLYGPIFQTNYFGRKTVIVGGPAPWASLPSIHFNSFQFISIHFNSFHVLSEVKSWASGIGATVCGCRKGDHQVCLAQHLLAAAPCRPG